MQDVDVEPAAQRVDHLDGPFRALAVAHGVREEAAVALDEDVAGPHVGQRPGAVHVVRAPFHEQATVGIGQHGVGGHVDATGQVHHSLQAGEVQDGEVVDADAEGVADRVGDLAGTVPEQLRHPLGSSPVAVENEVARDAEDSRRAVVVLAEEQDDVGPLTGDVAHVAELRPLSVGHLAAGVAPDQEVGGAAGIGSGEVGLDRIESEPDGRRVDEQQGRRDPERDENDPPPPSPARRAVVVDRAQTAITRNVAGAYWYDPRYE